MNKTYVLQHRLPDSEPGDEYIWNKSMQAYYKNGNVQDSYWKGDAIENNPSWFKPKQEDKPKEWEIINYFRPKDKSISTIPSLYEGDETEIHSVKRRSDNLIFSVDEDTPDGKIVSFEIDKGGVCMKANLEGNKYLWFHTLEKQPPVDKEAFVLKDFIKNFVGKNTLIRLWYKNESGHTQVDGDNCKMEWELSKSEFADCKVLYVKDIIVIGTPYLEAINIVIEKQLKSTPKEESKIEVTINEDAFKNRCNVCGDNLVYIRGKYPNTDKRSTCPTCTTERLEQINEISSKDYGKTYQNE